MIVGIGIDIVEIDRIERALRGSASMASKVFTEEERAYCEQRKKKNQHFAGRFAAKEAALKALGTGWQEGIRWKDVEVVADEKGKPELRFYRRASEIFSQMGATAALVTITHAESYALAMVILEK